MPAADAPRARAFGLTPREIDVLQLLTEGCSCRHIAGTLSITISTTRNHIRNILRKLAVHSQAEAIAFTYRNDLLQTRAQALVPPSGGVASRPSSADDNDID